MICGANVNFDSLLTSITSLEADLLSGMGKDALELKAELEASLTSLVSDLRSLVPELPTIPSISLQTGIQDLLGMIPGSPEYLTKLTSLTADFGSGLTAAGKDLTSLISGGADALLGGLDPCGVIPNFKMDAGGVVTEQPEEIMLPQEKTVPEDDVTFEDATKAFAAGLKTAVAKFKEATTKYAATPAPVLASYDDPTIDG